MSATDSARLDTLVSLGGVGKHYGSSEIIKDISLHLDRGEFVSIIGPSGCGKSTIFNLIAGLIDDHSGHMSIQGSVGYMQQKDLLLPWKTVLDNIALPLVLKGESRKAGRERANSYIELMGLRGYEDEYPYRLSGGMKQRASFLRTFLASEETMLLDEPFGALDSITKSKMQRWLLDIKTNLNLSILLITHDIDEALLLSDRLYIMSSRPGRIIRELHLPMLREDKTKRLVSGELLSIKEDILTLL
ncbi:ABC transporter ATP-binding protein [Paenibacillus pedocola]|uniref:ABC transporter ATP-binding protein n=1 Tax=Paenibacillus pedocola TaxID=3242193 RepID=UPI0028776B5A|nr:ABC transporter ATP-binding protein [Paenibacillus typhae]